MLQKELDLGDVPDPLYIPMNTIDGKTFYLQPGTSEVLLERPIVNPCRGGILCEELGSYGLAFLAEKVKILLGTGKTVMMLSLIMATRSQISQPEPSVMDPERPVLTPLAFRHFPSDDFSTARKRASFGPEKKQEMPSLVELMLHHARTTPYTNISSHLSPEAHNRIISIEEGVYNLPLGDVLRANVPFYHQYQADPTNRERVQRKRGEVAPRTIFLTSATLIVVPQNLLSQWHREIIKHCQPDNPLRVLILRSKTPVPSVQSLATDYDVSQELFRLMNSISSDDSFSRSS